MVFMPNRAIAISKKSVTLHFDERPSAFTMQNDQCLAPEVCFRLNIAPRPIGHRLCDPDGS